LSDHENTLEALYQYLSNIESFAGEKQNGEDSRKDGNLAT